MAGFTQPQFQAFDATQANQGAWAPYIGAAGGLTAAGAGPAAGGIGQYINPFQQHVVDAAMNDWQEQSARTMQQVNSNAAGIGALTGDRSQVAQQLAREAGDRAMSSNIANLYSQGFNTALGAAQNDQNRYLAAGQQFAGLGGLAQQYGYQDVNALLGIGGMQQGQNQAELDANTANAQLRAQYPMYMLDWQNQGLTGLGSAAGSKSTGTQQTPGPSMFSQVGGLALSAAGLYNNWGKPAANGGRIESEGGMSKLIRDVGAAADGLASIRRRCGGRVGYMDGGGVEDEVLPWATPSPSMGVGAIAAPTTSEPGGLGNLGLSNDAGTALMAAGFGMMGSNSPHALGALGNGGLAGLNTYNSLLERRRREAKDAAKANEGRTFEMNGRLVRALPDGTVTELYSAPETEEQKLEREIKRAQLQKAQADLARGVAPEYKEIDGRLVQIGPDGVKEVYVAPTASVGDDKTPQGRAALAKSLNLKEGSDAYNSYVMTGKLPREDQQRLTVTDKKAILDADEAVSSTEGAIASLNRAMELSKTAYDGLLAGERGWLASQFGSGTGNDTRELNQVVTEGALQQLKAIFGGMPTEGERKILLEIQGSAEMPQEVRDRIYQRAMALAQRRLKFNRDRASELRAGTFYEREQPTAAPEQYAPNDTVAGAPPVGTVVDGYEYKGGDPADRKSWEQVQ